MANIANLHSSIVGESLPAIPKVPNIQRTCPKSFGHLKCFEEVQLQPLHNEQCSMALKSTTRRSILGLASFALITQVRVKTSLAEEENKLWLDFPLPGLPPVDNKIDNEETGTRSFLKKGLYIANIGTKGSAFRLKKYAFDLMAMGDSIGQDAWNYIRRYLRLKGTFMYYDFDKVISAAPVSEKQPLTDLANRLFDNFEKLQDAVKVKDLPLTEACYKDTTVILQEVMDRMA